MTFSIAARCAKSGMLGLAVASSSPAVAARCSHVRAAAGAIASQNITDPRLGLSGLDLLATGLTADETLARLISQAGEAIAFRQITVLDRDGRTAGLSGAKVLGIYAIAHGHGAVAAGNMLKHDGIPAAMVGHFTGSGAADFGDRLIGAMRAGLDAGGEAGPIHSIGLKIARDVPWPVADLRVDWHETDPLGALQHLWNLYAPQLEDYVTRALAPAAAPSFGMAGDK